MNSEEAVLGRRRIRWLVMDVDGTLTDGKVYFGQDGQEIKAFNIKDGYGIRNILPQCGIEPVIITGRSSVAVSKRSEELRIDRVYQNVQDKVSLLNQIIPANQLEQVAYIGDDLNDLSAMQSVHAAGGIVGCPLDASTIVQKVADFVATRRGGDGAVREFIDWLVAP